MKTEIYDQLKTTAYSLLDSNGMLDKAVTVTARTSRPLEVIGDPDSENFPIQKGRERLMQADLEGAAGPDHFAYLSNLDEDNARYLRAELKTHLHHFRITTIFVPHNRKEARELADRIAIMETGRLIFQIDKRGDHGI